jgi:hypothetical protein
MCIVMIGLEASFTSIFEKRLDTFLPSDAFFAPDGVLDWLSGKEQAATRVSAFAHLAAA